MILSELLKKLVGLAQDSFSSYKAEAKKDIEKFYSESKDDLKRWIEMLGKGEITKENFSSLIEGQKSLLEMQLLYQKGVALITLQKFRDGAFKLIQETVFGLLP